MESITSISGGDSGPSGPSRAQDITIVNNAELRANQLNVLNLTRASRPKNTTKAYDPKQEEFKVSSSCSLVAGDEPATQPLLILISPSFPLGIL